MRNLFKTIHIYTLLMCTASFLSLMKILIFAKILNVSNFGQYSLALLISLYLLFMMNMGLEPGFLRNGSLMWGRNEYDGLSILQNNVISFTILSGVPFSIFIYIFFLVSPLPEKFKYESILFVGFLSSSTLFFNISTTILRIKSCLISYSLSLTTRNLLVIGIGYYLAIQNGATGAILAEILSLVFVSSMIFVKEKIRIIFPNKKILFPVIKIGIAFTGNYFLRNLLLNLDRWFVAFALNVTYFAYYSFAMMIFTIGTSIQNIIVQSVVPPWISEFGKHCSLSLLHANIIRLVMKIIIFCVPITIFFAMAMPFTIKVFIPKYIPAIPIIYVIYFGTLAHLLNFMEFSFMAQGDGKPLLIITIANMFFIVTALIVGVKMISNDKSMLLYFASIFCVGRFILLFLTWFIAVTRKRQNTVVMISG
ncbi:MAG: oligosaccharide flippase family protein [Candidatus Cloacimonadia bacterium]